MAEKLEKVICPRCGCEMFKLRNYFLPRDAPDEYFWSCPRCVYKIPVEDVKP